MLPYVHSYDTVPLVTITHQQYRKPAQFKPNSSTMHCNIILPSDVSIDIFKQNFVFLYTPPCSLNVSLFPSWVKRKVKGVNYGSSHCPLSSTLEYLRLGSSNMFFAIFFRIVAQLKHTRGWSYIILWIGCKYELHFMQI